MKAFSPICYPKKYILEASILLDKSLFSCLNNIYILLQTVGLGSVLTVTDPAFLLYLKQDTD